MPGAAGDRPAWVVGIGELHRCVATVFERLDLPAADADALAGLLVDTELRGHPDHGVAAVDFLMRCYRTGTLNPTPHVTVLHETDGALLLDGDRGCGPGAPERAMRWCVEKARDRGGMAVAAVRDWQLVVTGAFPRIAAEAGLVGFACTNYEPVIAPPGGVTPVLGTNPMAYAVPADRQPPVVVDIATSASAVLKVRVAAAQGTAMPEGAILDRDGAITTDPARFLTEGGLLTPLGFPLAPHKGFGLGLVVDILGGVLSGSTSGGDVTVGRTGCFFWALDVAAFMPVEEFRARVDALLDQVMGGERRPEAAELLAPGVRGARRHQELTARGTVPLAPESRQVLADACASLGVPLPVPARDGD